jgi:AcrR family transcriptional regulator
LVNAKIPEEAASGEIGAMGSPRMSMEKPGRRDTDGVCARQEEILDAATTLFAEHGFSDAVTQDIAEKLQIGKGTIYRYYPSKRDLFLAAADRVMLRMRARIEAGIEGITDPLERFCQANRLFFEFFADHPEFIELLILERALFKDRQRPTYFEHREKNVGRWRELFRALITDGRIRAMPVDRITDVVSGMCYGTIFLDYFTGRRRSPAEQSRDILDVLFHGILSDAARGCLEAGAPVTGL